MFSNGPRTVTTGLSLLVDAADPLSYPGSGTNWTDIVTGITGSLSGSITYASDFKGALVVNNSSSVIIFPTSSANFGLNSFTVELAFQPNQINGQHWLVAKNSGSFPSWGAFITGSSGSGRITAFFNISSTVSCSMSTPTGSIVTGSNYLVDINFTPFVGGINTIYINSEASASALPNGSGSLSATSSLFISNRNSGSSVGVPLEIFNAKLYTPKLVTGRIRQNYNALSTRLGLPQKSFLPIIEDRLLDFYPGAAAAYSLRLLNSNYSGAAIRVRRSSDNTEQDIGFSNLVLDTAALLSFVGAGDGFVTTWYDQSENARNVTQTTAIKQPQIVSSGTVVTQNGKTAILGTDTSVLTAVTTTISQPYTIFSVVKGNNVGAQRFISDGSGLNTSQFAIQSQFQLGIFAGNGVYHNTPTSLTTQFIAYSLFNTTTSEVAINQETATLGNVGSVNIGTRITLMNGGDLNVRGLVGWMQEYIIYTSNQSSNRTGINTNINSYYQIY